MPNNNVFLNKAIACKNDEFFTLYETVEEELKHYKKFLKNKKILCNCNDGEESNFYKFLKQVAQEWEIQKIVGLSFNNLKPYKIIYQTALKKEEKIWIADDGSFENGESLKELENCDVVITNPPFSKIREWMRLVFKYNKDFIVLANMNIIAYPEIFLKIKDNKCYAGVNFNKPVVFKTPYQNDVELNQKFVKSKGYEPKDGYVKVTISWFTSFNVKSDTFIKLKNNCKVQDYIFYDNYKAINVSKVKDIPFEYKGIIGVPISFIGKYNPQQFEILGMASQSKYKPEIVGIPILNGVDARPVIKGKKCYARIFIKAK